MSMTKSLLLHAAAFTIAAMIPAFSTGISAQDNPSPETEKRMGSTNIFKVLSDAQRRDILVMLKNGRMNASEIADALKITPAVTDG